MSAGILYIVSTPIGNLGDMTYRAVEVLRGVDWIACEDTRHSKHLLDHYAIQKPLLSYHDFSEQRKAPLLVSRLLGGEKGAIVSDAGTPGIEDPGYRLIQLAIREGVRVEALPGASAFLTALTLSGLPLHRFSFEGFAPVKQGAKKKWLNEIAAADRTVIFYESPYRVLKTLETMKEVYGDIHAVVARELTKKFEEVRRDSLSGLIEHFRTKKTLGEFVILFNLQGRG